MASDFFTAEDEHWMRYALDLAAKGEVIGEVPVGAVIVRDNRILGEGWNKPISSCDPSAHAEIIALRQAGEQEKNYRLVGARLYVTLEPCTMCVGALIHARISRLMFGTTEPKAGAVVSRARMLDQDYFNHKLDYAGGLLAAECQHQLSRFFQLRREQKKLQRQSQDVQEDE